MRVLICGGRDFGHVVRTTGNTDDEPDDVKAKLREYEFGLDQIEQIAFNRFPRTEPDKFGNFLYDVTIVEGGATGADDIGASWAAINWARLEEYPADWSLGKKAGPLRNTEMLNTGIDLVIAFPGKRGTADMVRQATERGIEIIEISYP